MANYTKNICSLLTPPGRGAVAVIAINGTAKEIIDSNFEPANGKQFATEKRRKIVYGVWKSTGEDLIVYCRSAGNFEIHCHGGSMASKAIVDDLKSAGVEEVSPQSFFKNTDACFPSGPTLSRQLPMRLAHLNSNPHSSKLSRSKLGRSLELGLLNPDRLFFAANQMLAKAAWSMPSLAFNVPSSMKPQGQRAMSFRNQRQSPVGPLSFETPLA